MMLKYFFNTSSSKTSRQLFELIKCNNQFNLYFKLFYMLSSQQSISQSPKNNLEYHPSADRLKLQVFMINVPF